MAKKQWGYWISWDNFEEEMISMIGELGHFPTQSELGKAGRSDLNNAMRKHHGGIRTVRERLGYEQIIKQNGHYINPKTIQTEVQEIIGDIRHFPSPGELQKMGKSSLAAAICAHHGGFPELRTRMGYDLARKPDGHYGNWNNLERGLQRIIEVVGRFPSQKEIKENEKGSLCSAIYKHHGGLPAVRQRMGYSPVLKDRGYWQDWENLESELREVIDEISHFPTHTELKQMKKTALSAAILQHGGTSTVREKLGEDLGRKPPEYWKDWNNLEGELQRIIEENDGKFPSARDLVRLGYHHLQKPMGKYHGGFPAVREKMDFSQATKPSGYWQQWENVESELRIVIGELGRFPRHADLKPTRSTILMAITKYHGGFPAVRERMGYSEPDGKDQLESILQTYIGGNVNE